MTGIQFNVSDREMHSMDKDLPRMAFPLDGMFCHVPGCPVQAHHFGMYRDHMKHWKEYHIKHYSVVKCPLCTVRVFKSLHFLRRHFQLGHNVDHQYLPVVETLVRTLKRERVTYCDPGRVLPPKRPDTNVANVSEEVQVITIEESISPREAARRERQRVALSIRNILTDDDRYVEFNDL